ncbi:SDR family oxidoreductase [Litchfieldella xinjiangensis]|uniref:SDR family oxidoreductase n=1 Tax=Litchfieldella xinjiangensis TaxID=1166948 RepID=UPI0005BC3296|nr:SDR family oxidoreductase [Halomonas xinjiangensis]
MALRLRELHDQTIVLTGATTGIGLATARLAADHGARLVLAARHEQTLAQLAEEVRQRGGDATYVVTDVGDEAQVRNLADTAIERFGGFDTWINNAGVTIYGEVVDVPMEDHRRSREAPRHLRKRKDGYGGAILNLGSIVSDRAIPLQGMYSASKHAVMGFTDALRMELEEAGAPVAVTLVKPGSIATPYPEHAANYMEEEPTLPPKLYEPSIVAESILHCATTPRRDIYVGGGGKMLSALGQYAPRLADKIMEKSMFSRQKTGRPERRREFSLHHAAEDMKERAEYDQSVASTSIYTRATMHPLIATSAVAGAVIGVAALARVTSQRRH